VDFGSLTKYDKGLICLLVLFALFSFWGTFYLANSFGKPGEIVVSLNGQVFGRYSLQGKSTLKVEGEQGESEIEIHDGRVRMVSSPCLQKTCIKSGWISKPGSSIVCAPNRLVIKIIGEGKKNSPDAVSQ